MSIRTIDAFWDRQTRVDLNHNFEELHRLTTLPGKLEETGIITDSRINLFDGVYEDGLLNFNSGLLYPVKNYDGYKGKTAVIKVKPNTTYTARAYDAITSVFRVGLSVNKPVFKAGSTSESIPLDETVINAVAADGTREVTFTTGGNHNYLSVYASLDGTERPLQVEESKRSSDRFYNPKIIDPKYIEIPTLTNELNSRKIYGFYDSVPEKYHYHVAPDGSESDSDQDLAIRDINYFYGLYDELMDQHPEYVSKRLLGYGSDVDGNEDTTLPIYEYTFEPPMAEVDVSFKRPIVLLDSFVHGSELSSGYALYLFIKDICDSYETNKVTEFMYYNIEFRVLPIANPWGFNNNTRLNARGVDVNSNFDTDFIKYPKGHIYYGGDESMSETETWVRERWFQEFSSDAICYLNMHNFASISGEYNVSWMASYGEDVRTMLAHTTNSLSRYWRSYGGKFETAPARTVNGIVTERVAGTTRRQAHKKYGIPSVTIDQLQNLSKMELPNAKKHDKWATQISLDTIGAVLIGFLKNFT